MAHRRVAAALLLITAHACAVHAQEYPAAVAEPTPRAVAAPGWSQMVLAVCCLLLVISHQALCMITAKIVVVFEAQ